MARHTSSRSGNISLRRRMRERLFVEKKQYACQCQHGEKKTIMNRIETHFLLHGGVKYKNQSEAGRRQ